MGELLNEFMTPQVKFILGAFVVVLVLIYVASIIWVYRDANLRGANTIMWTAVSVIPIAGILLYTILRPPLYELDRREQELEIARRERELYTEGYCRSCSYPIEPDYLICPNCKVKLKKECVNCGHALKPKWDVCPYCRTAQEPGATATPASASSKPTRTVRVKRTTK